MESIVQLIGSVGFPIAACCAMGWYVKVEIAALREVIDRNSDLVESLTKIVERLDNDMKK